MQAPHGVAMWEGRADPAIGERRADRPRPNDDRPLRPDGGEEVGGREEGIGPVARSRAAARARGEAQVMNFWDSSAVERERRARQRRATVREYVEVRGGAAYDAQHARRLEIVVMGAAEADLLSQELRHVRARRETTQRELNMHADAAAGAGPSAPTDRSGEALKRVAALRVWYDILRQAEHELSLRTQWALACVARESVDLKVEACKAPRPLPERIVALSADAQPAALSAELAALEAAVDAQGRVCFELEAQARALHEQGRLECRADREAQRRAAMAAPLQLMLRASTADAAEAMRAMAQPAAVGGTTLSSFLSAPMGATCRALHDAAAQLAPHTCAVTLALRVALISWVRERTTGAVPAGSFDAPAALLGTRPDQMQWKLDAVRYCASMAGLRRQSPQAMELVASWMLREVPEMVAVPCALAPLPIGAPAAAAAANPVVSGGEYGAGGAPPPRYTLPDGSPLDCVSAVEDEKERIFDGVAMVRGQHEGQVSGASFEPGPWTWEASCGVWRRDVFPHDVLVATPCGHAYSERFWSTTMSTTIERGANAHTFHARKARCCAPLAGGGVCGRPLSDTAALRVTGCRARVPRYGAHHELGATAALCVGASSTLGGAAPLPPPSPAVAHAPLMPLHGSWGSRVEMVVRLLLSLRAAAEAAGDSAAAKAVVFSRHEAVLRLLQAACAMNGVRALRYGTTSQLHAEVATFIADTSVHALLLSAQRDASGLTLTAASHVVIVEPQPDVAIEQQMIGRVYRIGQMRQTHVHRVVVDGSFETVVVDDRLAAEAGAAGGGGAASHLLPLRDTE